MYKNESIFQLKDNEVITFKLKRRVPFAVLKHINKGLDILEALGLISPKINSLGSSNRICKKRNIMNSCFLQD